MAEYKMTAGGTFHTLTQDELHSTLKQWQLDRIKGLRTVTISAQGTTDASGNLTLGGPFALTGGKLGPAAGYVWAVKRLAIRVNGLTNVAWSLYVNNPDANNLVRDQPNTGTGYVSFSDTELILNGDDTLCFGFTGVGANVSVSVSGQGIEAPIGLLWKLLS